MPVRLFVGYFVALAACATVAFASFGSDGADTPGSLASERPLPASAFPVHPHKLLPKPIQIAQAE